MNIVIYQKWSIAQVINYDPVLLRLPVHWHFLFSPPFFLQENLDLVVAKGSGKRRTVLRSGSVVRKRDPVTGGEV